MTPDPLLDFLTQNTLDAGVLFKFLFKLTYGLLALF